MKRTITILLGHIGNWGTLNDLEELVQEARKRANAEGIERTQIEIDHSEYDDLRMKVFGYRPETEAEEKERLIQEEISAKRRIDRLKKDAEALGFKIVKDTDG